MSITLSRTFSDLKAFNPTMGERWQPSTGCHGKIERERIGGAFALGPSQSLMCLGAASSRLSPLPFNLRGSRH